MKEILTLVLLQKKIKLLLAIISNLCIPNAHSDLLDVKYLSEKMIFKYI